MWEGRLKEMGCPIPDLLEVLRHQIISLMEQAVPYWGPIIKKRESNMLERVLKTALHIIYQADYVSFSNALNLAHMKSLAQRRKDIIFKFSKSCEKSEKYSDWLSKLENNTFRNTRTRQAR